MKDCKTCAHCVSVDRCNHGQRRCSDGSYPLCDDEREECSGKHWVGVGLTLEREHKVPVDDFIEEMERAHESHEPFYIRFRHKIQRIIHALSIRTG